MKLWLWKYWNGVEIALVVLFGFDVREKEQRRVIKVCVCLGGKKGWKFWLLMRS